MRKSLGNKNTTSSDALDVLPKHIDEPPKHCHVLLEKLSEAELENKTADASSHAHDVLPMHCHVLLERLPKTGLENKKAKKRGREKEEAEPNLPSSKKRRLKASATPSASELEAHSKREKRKLKTHPKREKRATKKSDSKASISRKTRHAKQNQAGIKRVGKLKRKVETESTTEKSQQKGRESGGDDTSTEKEYEEKSSLYHFIKEKSKYLDEDGKAQQKPESSKSRTFHYGTDFYIKVFKDYLKRLKEQHVKKKSSDFLPAGIDNELTLENAAGESEVNKKLVEWIVKRALNKEVCLEDEWEKIKNAIDKAESQMLEEYRKSADKSNRPKKQKSQSSYFYAPKKPKLSRSVAVECQDDKQINIDKPTSNYHISERETETSKTLQPSKSVSDIAIPSSVQKQHKASSLEHADATDTETVAENLENYSETQKLSTLYVKDIDFEVSAKQESLFSKQKRDSTSSNEDTKSKAQESEEIVTLVESSEKYDKIQKSSSDCDSIDLKDSNQQGNVCVKDKELEDPLPTDGNSSLSLSVLKKSDKTHKPSSEFDTIDLKDSDQQGSVCAKDKELYTLSPKEPLPTDGNTSLSLSVLEKSDTTHKPSSVFDTIDLKDSDQKGSVCVKDKELYTLSPKEPLPTDGNTSLPLSVSEKSDKTQKPSSEFDTIDLKDSDQQGSVCAKDKELYTLSPKEPLPTDGNTSLSLTVSEKSDKTHKPSNEFDTSDLKDSKLQEGLCESNKKLNAFSSSSDENSNIPISIENHSKENQESIFVSKIEEETSSDSENLIGSDKLDNLDIECSTPAYTDEMCILKNEQTVVVDTKSSDKVSTHTISPSADNTTDDDNLTYIIIDPEVEVVCATQVQTCYDISTSSIISDSKSGYNNEEEKDSCAAANLSMPVEEVHTSDEEEIYSDMVQNIISCIEKDSSTKNQVKEVITSDEKLDDTLKIMPVVVEKADHESTKIDASFINGSYDPSVKLTEDIEINCIEQPQAYDVISDAEEEEFNRPDEESRHETRRNIFVTQPIPKAVSVLRSDGLCYLTELKETNEEKKGFKSEYSKNCSDEGNRIVQEVGMAKELQDENNEKMKQKTEKKKISAWRGFRI